MTFEAHEALRLRALSRSGLLEASSDPASEAGVPGLSTHFQTPPVRPMTVE
jgi:hypothetical protein